MRALILALSLLLVACSGGCDQKPNPHVEWPPNAQWDGAGTCDRAAQNLARLGCPEAQPTPKGATFQSACPTWVDAGLMSPERVLCVEHAASVEAVRACKVKCVVSP